MGASHHGPEQQQGPPSPEQQKLMERFIKQIEGTAKREYSQGRMSGDDDGDLALAVASDLRKNIVIIRFGKPVEWIGLGITEAEGLRDLLLTHINNLRAPV